MNNNERLAHEFIEAIKTMAEKPELLDNFESYLSHHFDVWMEKYAYDPESLTSEVKQFSKIEF